MCNKNTENKANRRELILQHLTKWKPAYELAGVLSVITVICFGGISIRQTQKSLEVTIESLTLSNKSLELQEKQFLLHNRPIVVVGSHQFSGSTRDSTGKSFPRSIKVHLKNIADVPATQVQGAFTVFLNGETIGSADLLPPTSVAKSTTKFVVLGLSEEMYSKAINFDNKFETTFEVTYSGMLGEKSKQIYDKKR